MVAASTASPARRSAYDLQERLPCPNTGRSCAPTWAVMASSIRNGTLTLRILVVIAASSTIRLTHNCELSIRFDRRAYSEQRSQQRRPANIYAVNFR